MSGREEKSQATSEGTNSDGPDPARSTEQFERERLSRRQALRKFGVTTGMVMSAALSLDDFAHAMQQRTRRLGRPAPPVLPRPPRPIFTATTGSGTGSGVGSR